MNETKVIWHPYPETSPKKEGFYLLTIEIPFLGMFIEPVERELQFAYWDGKGFFARIKDGERITAWTFQPEPYKPEVKKWKIELTSPISTLMMIKHTQNVKGAI